MVEILSVDNMRKSDAATIRGGIAGKELMYLKAWNGSRPWGSSAESGITRETAMCWPGCSPI